MQSKTPGIAPPEYRLPDEIRLGPVRLQISDEGRSRAFYEETLGFHFLGRTEGTVVFGTPAGEPLVELVVHPGTSLVAPHSRLGLFHVAFLLPGRPDLAAFVAHLNASGIRAGMSDHLVSEAIYLRDPDGLGIEVYADRPRTTWRTEGDEIAMATLPLDLESLRTVYGGPWQGAPSGTRVGHVHLHVGRLDTAERFYHRSVGLDKMVWSYPGALFLAAGGYHHHLGLNTWADSAPPPGKDEAKLLEWTVFVPTARDLSEVAVHLGRHEAPVTRDERGLTTADPWGTRLRFAVEPTEA